MDIETSPIVGYTWGTYETNVIKRLKGFTILSVAYKWLGKRTEVIACDNQNEMSLLTKLHKLLNEADIVVAHNGDSFDVKKINARFIIHKFSPPSLYKTVDTRKEAKRIAAFDSSSLENLGIDMGEGEKIKHRGFSMWEGCMAGDQTSWEEMKKYNKKDVDLLERIYLRLRGWMKKHPNLNVYTEEPTDRYACPNCGSKRTNREGREYGINFVKQRYTCLNCRRRFVGEKISNRRITVL